MSPEAYTPAPTPSPQPTSAATPRRGGFGRALLTLLVLALLGAAGWTWFSLSWSYSVGDRAGVLQKVSRKGWICKTWEGELAQFIVAGVAPQIWTFSVREASVAAQLSASVGERVQLHYSEHVGVPTACFGDTRYYVERVTVLDVAQRGAPAAPAAPATPATSPPAAVPAPAGPAATSP